MPAHDNGRLSTFAKAVYASGDHTVNLSLSALSILLLFFLTEVAGLQPVLAGAVIWCARLVDGVSDPLMGRISDLTRLRSGRRRPYFLIGAIPFALFFSLLWLTPFEQQWSKFAYYLTIYIGLSLSMTVVSVPYLALIPEMARDYDERTSLNTFRAMAAVLGTMAAAAMDALISAFGGGAPGYARAGVIAALWIVLPWPAVYAVSWERADTITRHSTGGFKAAADAARHGNFRRLCGLFISARIAVDVLGLSFPFFFTYALGRPSDWRIALLVTLGVVILSLPVWLRIASKVDKHVLFAIGCGWWAAMMGVLFYVTPDWPRWTVFAICGLVGIGYAVADLMPWAMLGEVIDEDRLRSGENREGIYNGLFTFLRKLGGASAAFLAGALLQLTGYTRDGIQPESALFAIRSLATLVPIFFLTVALLVAAGYPLGRTRHEEIMAQLDARGPTP